MYDENKYKIIYDIIYNICNLEFELTPDLTWEYLFYDEIDFLETVLKTEKSLNINIDENLYEELKSKPVIEFFNIFCKHTMKVTNILLKESNKRTKTQGGVYIEYISSDNVIKDSYVKLIYKESDHYFQVTDIELSGKDLKISAKEVGYWANKFDRMKDFDMRDIIGLDVIIVDDKESISKIHEMSCWC